MSNKREDRGEKKMIGGKKRGTEGEMRPIKRAMRGEGVEEAYEG